MLYDFKGKKKVSIVCANSETSALPFVHKLHGTSQNSVLARDQSFRWFDHMKSARELGGDREAEKSWTLKYSLGKSH